MIKLSETNFESVITAHEYTLIKFFAPWCGHCKSLAEPYKKAAEKLSTTPQDKLVKIGEIDCTEDGSKALCSKYNVRGYPTLLGFTKDMKSVEYDDGRTTDAIVAHVLGAVLPPVTIIKTAQDLTEFQTGPMDLKLIITTSDGEEGKVGKIVHEVAKSLRKIVSIGLDISKQGGGDDSDDNDVDTAVVTLHRTFDEPTIVYNPKTHGGAISTTTLTQFVQKYSLPLIGDIGPHNYKKYVDRNLPLVWIFIDPEDKGQVDTVEALKPIAEKFGDVLSFAKVDGKKWAKHAKSFGLESSTPGIVIENRTSKKKFLYPTPTPTTPFTPTAFETFIQQYKDGKLSPAIKSEPIPEGGVQHQLQLPITTVVGKTYQDIILDESKDVFVKFYAHWCGHCKALKPTYEELGEQFKNDSNIIIADFNAADNDAQIDISGYPTLYYFPASKTGKTEPIQYTGERTATAMAEFILKLRQSKVGTPKTAVTTAATPSTSTSDKEEL